MLKSIPLVLACVGLLTFIPHLRADSITLYPVSDTYLRDDSSADANFGNSDTILVGVSLDNSKHNHGLFRFSLADIPTNATVTGASLHIISTGGVTAAYDHGLHRMLKDWGELEATWNRRLLPSVNWGVAGGLAGEDFVAEPSAIAPIDIPPVTNVFTSTAVLDDVQLWINDAGTNFGWIVVAVNARLGSGKIVGSRENPAAKPFLTVDYTLPVAPVAFAISNLMLDEGQFMFSFFGTSNLSYTVESQDSLTNGGWDLVANIPTLPDNGEIRITNAISSDQRFFRVRTP